MIEIVAAGQYGKTKHLIEMHRFRKRVFHDRLGWDVPIQPNGLEIDAYDTPDTVYVLALDENKQVVGSWRLNPTTQPMMVRDLWPEFLNSIDIKSEPASWECSRFAVAHPRLNIGKSGASRVTEEIFCAVAELCVLCGIEKLYAMFDTRIALIHKKLNCQALALSEIRDIGNAACQVGAYKMDAAMLDALRNSTGIVDALVTPDMVPPNMTQYFSSTKSRKEDCKLENHRNFHINNFFYNTLHQNLTDNSDSNHEVKAGI
jgi:N-acyl-L-homoserine lactone synthetase